MKTSCAGTSLVRGLSSATNLSKSERQTVWFANARIRRLLAVCEAFANGGHYNTCYVEIGLKSVNIHAALTLQVIVR
jgi:hypothetical protein